ncbi:MAG: hypothetical protein ACREBU_17360 [Nitrososphaera sp.]
MWYQQAGEQQQNRATERYAEGTTKVQRGWKTAKTPLAEGNRIQYNFVKPHMALDGKTPAEVARIDAKGWKELLAAAAGHRKT